MTGQGGHCAWKYLPGCSSFGHNSGHKRSRGWVTVPQSLTAAQASPCTAALLSPPQLLAALLPLQGRPDAGLVRPLQALCQAPHTLSLACGVTHWSNLHARKQRHAQPDQVINQGHHPSATDPYRPNGRLSHPAVVPHLRPKLNRPGTTQTHIYWVALAGRCSMGMKMGMAMNCMGGGGWQGAGGA